MNEFRFKGIGTHWSVKIDAERIDLSLEGSVKAIVHDFEQQFSRFLPDSEVNMFRHSPPGNYSITETLSELLEAAKLLRTLTHGGYDPAVGGLLEHAGYNANYDLKEDGGVDTFVLPKWNIRNGILEIGGPTAFDLGGIGKGYCIDLVSKLLIASGYPFHMVEAGGDIMATTKANDQPWYVAIEMPGDPETAAGTVQLSNQGLAVSDSFKRRWGKWHHVLDPVTKRPIEKIIGVAAVSMSAWNADMMTSCLFLGNEEDYKSIASKLHSSFLIFFADQTVMKSTDWKGELFM